MHHPLSKLHWSLALSMLLFGCSTFEYIPPDTDAGRQCLATCEVATQTCQAGDRQAKALQGAMCESQKSNELTNCLKDAKTKDKREDCKDRAAAKCGFGNSMQYSYGNGSNCSVTYDRCFQTCGGQIIEHKH